MIFRPGPHKYMITEHTTWKKNKYRHMEGLQGRNKNLIMTRCALKKYLKEIAASVPISNEFLALPKFSAQPRVHSETGK